MGQTDPPDTTPLDAFLTRFWADQDDGLERSLGEYLCLFPGDEIGIAKEYLSTLAPLTPTQASPAPDRIGPYRKLLLLGKGAQGFVYLAEDTRVPGRQVAVKVLTSHATVADDLHRRFKREAEIASRLEDPGICPVLDMDLDSPEPYIVMRYVEGKTLASLISSAWESEESTIRDPLSAEFRIENSEATTEAQEEGPPSPPTTSSGIRRQRDWMEIIAVVEKIARSLHVAHEANIIHRDIKPGNIIISKNGQPVILDFGLARDLGRSTLAQKGQLLGTPYYMSPEQLAADRISLDRRTDVFSLGVVLFQCLTLQRPFDAPSRDGLYRAIMTKDPADIRKLNPALPSDLKVVVETALEKDLDRRYQSALEVGEELRRIREYLPIKARPATPWIKVKRWAQRNPGVAKSLSAATLCLILGLIVSLSFYVEAASALKSEKKALGLYEQMSDVHVMEELVKELRLLWPRRRERVPAMTQWIRRAEALLSRIPQHRVARRDLALAAHPRDEAAEKAKRVEKYPELMEVLTSKSKELAWVKRRLSSPSETEKERSELRDREEKLAAEVSAIELDPRLRAHLIWTFDRPGDALRYALLSKLIQQAESLPTMIADMKARRSFAEGLAEESLEKESEAWSTCLAEVETNPRYAGLKMTPQLGLVPLGKDTGSGLWEFWQVGSGQRPRWLPSRDHPGTGQVKPEDDSGLVMVLLPGGRFFMGATKDQGGPNPDPGALPDESPVTDVVLAPFFMSKYEFTQSQWQLLMGKNLSQYAAGKEIDHHTLTRHNPVTNVSWLECEEAVRRLGLLLPTEAQWEFACRAGTTWPWWSGDLLSSIQDHGNIADRTAAKTREWLYEPELNDGHLVHAPVGSFLPNAFGLHDTLGNVSEWCRDRFRGYEKETPRTGDGLRLGWRSQNRVTRGGHFASCARNARSAFRGCLAPGERGGAFGFRPSRSVVP